MNMNYETKDNNITFKLDGRIDSSNCGEFETNIFQIIENNVFEKLVIDIKELEYISSAGLRVFLKIKKNGTNLEIINASSEVYEIFEVTGFVEILDIKKALRFISVEGLEVIGKGGHGHVYRLDDETIVKVYHDNASMEIIDTERLRAKNAFIQGIASPIAFDVVNTEEGPGVVFEMAGAQTLSSYLMENPDKLEEYSVKFGELIKQFNNTEMKDENVSNIADIYRQRIELGKPYFTEEEYNICIRMLEAIERKSTMIHGDFHPNNVMINKDGELMIIDMADISKGNPIFDIGGCYTSMIQSGANNPDMTFAVVGIDYEKSKKMYDIAIKTYYNFASEEQLELIKKRLAAFGAFRTFSTIGISSANMNKYRGTLLELARNQFFPNAEGLIKLLGMQI